MKRKILIVGEHPGHTSGFAQLHRSIIKALQDIMEFDEITSLGITGALGTPVSNLGCTFINSAEYCQTETNTYGQDSIVKFLQDNPSYTDVLLLGDPWFYEGISVIRAIFGHRVAFHMYCPSESEHFPTIVENANGVLSKNCDINHVLSNIDNVIAYSKTGMKAINELPDAKSNSFVYHWTNIPTVEPQPIKELDEILQQYDNIIGIIGRNIVRKGTDLLYDLTKYIPDNTAILAHVPKHDTHGWSFDLIEHFVSDDAKKRVIFTEDYVRGLYYKRHGNILRRSMKSGLPQAKMEWLYKQMDIYICLSRAEGFGFPIIESMIRKVPVVSNDYATPGEIVRQTETDALVPISVEELCPRGIYYTLGTPNVEAFGKKITRYLKHKKAPDSMLKEIREKQYNYTLQNFTYKNSDHPIKMSSCIKNFDKLKENRNNVKRDEIIHITSPMKQCGIRTYTNNITDNGDEVIGIKDVSKLTNMIQMITNRIFHIQFEPALYDKSKLVKLINAIKTPKNNNKLIMTVHTFHDSLNEILSKDTVDHIISHVELPEEIKEKHIEYSIMPHPIPEYDINKVSAKYKLGFDKKDIVVGLNGFALPYKKLVTQAKYICHMMNKKGNENIKLYIVCSPHSSDRFHIGEGIMRGIRKIAEKYKVEDKVKIKYGFLPKDEMAYHLSAIDFGLLYHNNSSIGSQSGSIRELLACEVIPIVTESNNQQMHHDLVTSNLAIALRKKDKAYISDDEFSSGACQILSSNDIINNKEKLINTIRDYKKTNSFSRAKKLMKEKIYNKYNKG